MAPSYRSQSIYRFTATNFCAGIARLFHVHHPNATLTIDVVPPPEEAEARVDPSRFRTRLGELSEQLDEFVADLTPETRIDVLKSSHVADDVESLLHVVNWKIISALLGRRSPATRPTAAQQKVITRAGELIARVVESVERRRPTPRRLRRRRHFHFSDESNDDDDADANGERHVQMTFSVPVPPHFLIDVLYHASEWIERVARWSPTSPVYWFSSTAGHIFDVTPFGVSDATLFEIDYDDGFSASYGEAPVALQESFARYKSQATDAPLMYHVLPDIVGVHRPVRRPMGRTAMRDDSEDETITTSSPMDYVANHNNEDDDGEAATQQS